MILFCGIFVVLIVCVVFLCKMSFDVFYNSTPQLPLPSQNEIDKLIDPGNSSLGIAIFAHVSDLHIGNTSYITENSRLQILFYINFYIYLLLLLVFYLILLAML